MNPAAPVTRIRTSASYASAFVALAVTALAAMAVAPAQLLGVPDLRPVALEPAGTLEVLERLVARSELRERRAEVVLRVRLVEPAGARERGERQSGETLGPGRVAGLQKAGRLVGEARAAGRGRRRWGWRRRRRRRRRGRWLCNRRSGGRRLDRLPVIAASGEQRRDARSGEECSGDDCGDEWPRRPLLRGGEDAGRGRSALERLAERRHECGGGL